MHDEIEKSIDENLRIVYSNFIERQEGKRFIPGFPFLPERVPAKKTVWSEVISNFHFQTNQSKFHEYLVQTEQLTQYENYTYQLFLLIESDAIFGDESLYFNFFTASIVSRLLYNKERSEEVAELVKKDCPIDSQFLFNPLFYNSTNLGVGGQFFLTEYGTSAITIYDAIDKIRCALQLVSNLTYPSVIEWNNSRFKRFAFAVKEVINQRYGSSNIIAYFLEQSLGLNLRNQRYNSATSSLRWVEDNELAIQALASYIKEEIMNRFNLEYYSQIFIPQRKHR